MPRNFRFVSPAEGGSVVVGRLKEILLGEEDVRRPTIGSPATSLICTICAVLLWLATGIICLTIGIIHRNRCDNLESNLPIYLIVQGILSLIYSVTCGIGCSSVANCWRMTSWVVSAWMFIVAIINVILAMLLIVWLIIGSIWLWNNWEDWDSNRMSCTNEIYITAMASIIVHYTYWFFVFFFVVCQGFWTFCDKENAEFA